MRASCHPCCMAARPGSPGTVGHTPSCKVVQHVYQSPPLYQKHDLQRRVLRRTGPASVQSSRAPTAAAVRAVPVASEGSHGRRPAGARNGNLERRAQLHKQISGGTADPTDRRHTAGETRTMPEHPNGAKLPPRKICHHEPSDGRSPRLSAPQLVPYGRMPPPSLHEAACECPQPGHRDGPVESRRPRPPARRGEAVWVRRRAGRTARRGGVSAHRTPAPGVRLQYVLRNNHCRFSTTSNSNNILDILCHPLYNHSKYEL